MGKITAEENLLFHADKIIDICNSGKSKLKLFDGFVPIIPELYEDEDIIFTDVTPKALDSVANISVLRLGKPDGKTQAERGWQFHKVRKITTKELRKKTGIFSVEPYELDVAFESFPKVQDAFFVFRNQKIRVLDIPNYVCDPSMKQEIITTASITLGVQFNLENTPYVYLKPYNSEIGFSIWINDLAQVKELFTLREIPDGYKRRAALRHWVAKHLRRKPSKPDETVEVKRHLRGKESFEWFGIKGTIYVN